MNKSTVRKMERLLLPQDDGVNRSLVGLVETPAGLSCEACGEVHLNFEAAQRAHPGPGVLLLVEQLVKP